MCCKPWQDKTPGIYRYVQLAIGNILLNMGVDPIAFNFTNAGYTEGILKARELYDFDGILLHKPGREDPS